MDMYIGIGLALAPEWRRFSSLSPPYLRGSRAGKFKPQVRLSNRITGRGCQRIKDQAIPIAEFKNDPTLQTRPLESVTSLGGGSVLIGSDGSAANAMLPRPLCLAW